MPAINKAKQVSTKSMIREAEENAKYRVGGKVKYKFKDRAVLDSKEGKRFYSPKLTDDDFIDTVCPNCGERLSFFKGETLGICPTCDTKFNIKNGITAE